MASCHPQVRKTKFCVRTTRVLAFPCFFLLQNMLSSSRGQEAARRKSPDLATLVGLDGPLV